MQNTLKEILDSILDPTLVIQNIETGDIYPYFSVEGDFFYIDKKDINNPEFEFELSQVPIIGSLNDMDIVDTDGNNIKLVFIPYSQAIDIQKFA
jgi:hypothetical protein